MKDKYVVQDKGWGDCEYCAGKTRNLLVYSQGIVCDECLELHYTEIVQEERKLKKQDDQSLE